MLKMTKRIRLLQRKKNNRKACSIAHNSSLFCLEILSPIPRQQHAWSFVCISAKAAKAGKAGIKYQHNVRGKIMIENKLHFIYKRNPSKWINNMSCLTMLIPRRFSVE